MSKGGRLGVMPIITVDSVDEVHRFYTEKLGFLHMMGVVGEDGGLEFVTVVRSGVRIMFSRAREKVPGAEKSAGKHMRDHTPIGRLILVPALLTLGVTVLRLVGELTPGLPDMSPFARWIAIGVIPQFTIWIAVTVILGSLTGAGSLALVPPRRDPAPGER